jgi:hypothetical protein
MRGVSEELIRCDPPGFTQDEAVDELGANLRFRPWMEQARPEIEKTLSKITVPRKATL